jgi:hypothetical protein
MYIHAASAFMTPPVQDAQILKDELKKYTDVYFRRINKFVMLSLVGAHMCTYGKVIEPQTSVYLTTERGNLGDTENVLNQMFRRQALPMPYNFINTMSNTASFYVSQGLRVTGRNISVSSQNLSFERGLELLKTDVSLGVVKNAVIGGVDEANRSDVHFHKKFCVSSGSVIQMEGSCWLYLRSIADGAIGELTNIRSLTGKEEALTWLMARSYGEPPVISFGMAVKEEERAIWRKTIRHKEVFDYIKGNGYYDSATAGSASLFIRDYRNAILVHINKNFRGQYAILELKRY